MEQDTNGYDPARFTKKEKQIPKLTERAWNLFLEIPEQYMGEIWKEKSMRYRE